jgi:hypothetical protein
MTGGVQLYERGNVNRIDGDGTCRQAVAIIENASPSHDLAGTPLSTRAVREQAASLPRSSQTAASP